MEVVVGGGGGMGGLGREGAELGVSAAFRQLHGFAMERQAPVKLKDLYTNSTLTLH